MMAAPPTGGTAGTRSFGRYQVLRTLGAGGMGEVYLARDDLLAREVAVKTLRPLGLGGFAAEGLQARFLNEARAVAALSHPHVVQVFDLGFEGETPFLVMEVVGGRSLRDRLKAGERLAANEVRTLGIQIGRALDAAHARGIVHRDVKPGNVLEAEPGVWKLADFGVAHVPDSSLTMTGQFIGSPAYAAPEALLAGEFSPATDVYGLGATLYEALGGQPPYGDPGQASVATLVRRGDPQPIALRCPDAPPDLADAVQRALARDPEARPTAGALAAALAGATLSAPPPAFVAAGASLAAGSALAAGSVLAAGRAVADSPSVSWPAAPPVGPVVSTVGVATVPPNEAMTRAAVPSSITARRAPAAPRRWPWAAAGLGALLLLVILAVALAGSGDRDGRGAAVPWAPGASARDEGAPTPGAGSGERTAVGLSPGEGAALRPPPRVERTTEQQRRWLKAQEKLLEGKPDDAARELERLLERDPGDAEARALLESVEQGYVREGPGRGHGRGRGRGRGHGDD